MTNEEIIEGNKLIAEFMQQLPQDNRTNQLRKELGMPDKNYYTSWDWIMPVVEKIRNFKDPNRTEETYIFGNMSVHISDRYPTGWDCHILGTLTRFALLPTGMHDYRELPKYGNFISNENLIKAVWLSVFEFIKWYNQQSLWKVQSTYKNLPQ